MAPKLRYCPSCKRNVRTESKINWILFLILCCIFIIPGIIYLIWGYLSRRCPICKMPAKMLNEPRFDED